MHLVQVSDPCTKLTCPSLCPPAYLSTTLVLLLLWTLTGTDWSRDVNPMNAIRLVPEDLGIVYPWLDTLKHVFPFSVDPKSYIVRTSRKSCLGDERCINIVKDSSRYLSSVPLAVHIFLLFIPAPPSSFESLGNLRLSVLSRPQPKPLHRSHMSGRLHSRKGFSWEVSAADPDSSPSSVGQAAEGGSMICFLLLQCGSITDLSLSPRSEKVPNKKPAWFSCFPCSPCWLLGASWEMKAHTRFPYPRQQKQGPFSPITNGRAWKHCYLWLICPKSLV